jgi:hypothetical protein
LRREFTGSLFTQHRIIHDTGGRNLIPEYSESVTKGNRINAYRRNFKAESHLLQF